MPRVLIVEDDEFNGNAVVAVHAMRPQYTFPHHVLFHRYGA